MIKATTTKFAADMEALEAPPTIEELKAKAKEIISEVRAVLGERLTSESLSRGILYKAARASVISEKNFLALKCVAEMLEDQHRDSLHGVELNDAANKAREELDSWAMPLAETALKSLKNLDSGRNAGVKARQSVSKKKLAMIKNAVEDLRNNGPKMTAEEIRDFLYTRKLSPYSLGTTLKHVKTIIAQNKKNR